MKANQKSGGRVGCLGFLIVAAVLYLLMQVVSAPSRDAQRDWCNRHSTEVGITQAYYGYSPGSSEHWDDACNILYNDPDLGHAKNP